MSECALRFRCCVLNPFAGMTDAKCSFLNLHKKNWFEIMKRKFFGSGERECKQGGVPSIANNFV